MKIAVTGHTKGIGRAIFNQLSLAHEVIGLSRGNGYDIANINQIIDTVHHHDVFVNNACQGTDQEQLLIALYDLWANQDKTIINIGSAVTVYPRIEIQLNSQPWEYRDQKIALTNTFRRLAWSGNKCRLALINPGATDTDMIKHLECTKILPKEIANAVDLVLNNSYIKELTIYAK